MTVTAQQRTRARVRTLRRDRWWLAPLRDGVVLAAVIIYSTWAALQNTGYYADPYISPIFTPCVTSSCGEHALLVLIGDWWTLSPALVVVWVPILFRLTCYYYRKVYYRSYFLSPPACSVTEPRGRYRGEQRFPLILNNIHRYFWYLGVVISLVLTIDVVLALHFPAGWGVGVGTLVLAANATFFWLYTLSCHSCRHVLAGRLNHFSRHPLRYRMWTAVSRLNGRHPVFAWLSLPAIPLADLYVRLVANGVIPDLHIVM